MIRIFNLVIALLLWSPQISSKEIIGWVENVKLDNEELEVEAKIDSGADNSSLHVNTSEIFEKEGIQWISFKFIKSNKETIYLRHKIIRVAKIKRHDGNFQLRNVIEMGICLGNIYKKTEVNLIDRTGFDYQLLIGRSFLKNDFLIDVSHQHTSEPKCKNNAAISNESQ